MAAFYARYVPPSRPVERPETRDRYSSKRKHEGDQQNSKASRKRAKTETGDEADRLAQKQSHSSSEESRRTDLETSQVRAENGNNRQKWSHSDKDDIEDKEVLAKYSYVKVAGKSNSAYFSAPKHGGSEVGVLESDFRPAAAPAVHWETGKSKKKEDVRDGVTATVDRDKSAVNPDELQRIDDPSDQRHARVRQKFEASKAKAIMGASSREANDEREQGHDHPEDFNKRGTTTVVLHGLEPLPQPPQTNPSTEVAPYSALPGWIATPLQVPSTSIADFKDLNLDERILSNLQLKGLDKAFAVQAAVLPLLSEGKSRYRGDICISAATGSGKTLAYVLPLIQALKDLVGTKLRGLVVVPTRELVAQAREICEVCAAGTSLRIATALGSKARKEEQSALVGQYNVYDPEQYGREQEQTIDWTTFGLEHVLAQSDEGTPTVNYVKKFLSKADVLITTPGRLVDHLRSTPGFNLDDVQWVVVDEADRLLNESFQEWIEVVMPALKSDAATRSRDRILRELRLEVPERIVQKVILSATMTQDISKLKSLDLRHPKLIIVGDLPKHQPANENGVAVEDKDPIPDANGTFNLPPTLAEFAVSVGDNSEKPLYLLELLNSHILKPSGQQNGFRATSSESASLKTSSNFLNGTELESDDSSSSGSSGTADSDSASNVSRSASSSSSTFRPITPTQTILIFTRSTEAATRLSRLLSLLAPSLAPRLGTLTKSTNSSSTRKTLSQFRQGKIDILVATDRASRGLDLPGLAHVVSYDVPISATTYIHRVGRTARAGKEGKAWTLVGHREARWFWNQIGKSKEADTSGEVRVGRGDGKVKRVNIEVGREGDKESLRKRYEDALEVLGEEVKGHV